MALSNTAVPREYGAFREAVIRGEIPVCKNVSLEMNRIDFLIESPDFYYDDEAINGYIDFCEAELTLTNGEDLELLPTFKLWAECALAWFYFSDEKVYNFEKRKYEIVKVKRRLVNKQYLIVSRSNSKSLYNSSIQGYGLTVDTETTTGIVTAPTMRLAEEITMPIATAIKRARGPLFSFLTNGDIRSNTWTKQKLAATKKGIENFLTNSIIEIRTMSIDKLQGARSKYNSVDEWLSGKIKEDPIAALEQGAAKTGDYLIIATSSEGTVRDGIGDSIKMELQSILRGDVFNPHVSIWHYRQDSIQEINNPELWLKSNPNLGSTVSYSTIQKDLDRAEYSLHARNDIIAKRFGIPLEGYSYFFTYEETLMHPKKRFKHMSCSMGIDLSQGDDFCAFTFYFPLSDGRVGVKVKSYVSETKVNRLPSAMRLRYDKFVKEGTLVIMPCVVLDMMEVYEDIDEYIEKNQYDVVTVGYDPYNADGFISRWILEHGEYGVEVVKQGVRTESVPMGEIKNMATERILLFDEELMKFGMENSVAIEDNNGNIKLSKKRAEEKVDNVAALICARVAYNRNQEAFD